MKLQALHTAALASLLLAAGCGDDTSTEPAAGEGLAFGASDVTKVDPAKADSSAEAIVVDMAFAGELITDQSWNAKSQIDDQLLYTIGHLNGSNAVGRLDKVVLTDVQTSEVEGRTKIAYKASLQVAWQKRQGIPTEYAFSLPRDVSYSGQKAFTDKYAHTCVEHGAHDVTAGSMWYYFRPALSGCSLDAADVFIAKAAVTISPVNTTGKYPEYHRIWDDGVFNVVAVFGKYEDGATTTSDAGVRGYSTFNSAIRDLFAGDDLKVEPADAPRAPTVDAPDITYTAQIDAEHTVVVHAILVDNVRTAGRAFDARYGELSTEADLIVYNGHAGLGANIRALASKGQWKEGQYAMVFMNGCDTYAYVDNALFEAHADVNPDDPDGTLYTDVITNAKPAFFASMTGATMALVKGIVRFEQPRTYEQIFQDVDSNQIVLVSGEHDNVYVPGYGEGETEPQPEGWAGLSLDGTLVKDQAVPFETPVLKAGSYTFEMKGTGDADLYVRVGLAPTVSDYDCRPYKGGSVEACRIDVTTPTAILGMVRGYARTSTFELTVLPE